jgi:hypothetical protein
MAAVPAVHTTMCDSLRHNLNQRHPLN